MLLYTSALKQMSTVKPLTPKHHCANGVTKHVWPRVETLPTRENSGKTSPQTCIRSSKNDR